MMIGPTSLDHRTACRRHAAKRAFQRFGIALSLPDLERIEKLIWLGKAEWLADCDGRPRQVYRVRRFKRDLYVIFDIRLSCIVTFLRNRPPAEWKGGRH